MTMRKMMIALCALVLAVGNVSLASAQTCYQYPHGGVEVPCPPADDNGGKLGTVLAIATGVILLATIAEYGTSDDTPSLSFASDESGMNSWELVPDIRVDADSLGEGTPDIYSGIRLNLVF